ncbi:MAG: hypothetical protein SFU55_06280 [Methylophilus sp.]|nr:hypothetical protein [Methylophilus sp.]
MRFFLFILIYSFFSLNAQATKRLPETFPQFIDMTGVYDCTGDDAHEGKYTGTVTMKLKPEHTKGVYASYDFKLEVLGYGTYLGHAAANGNMVAMHFALTDPKTKDFGTGIAQFQYNKQGKLGFHKFYYEPEFKGGNTGLEDCVRKD